jgi:hypothetical protein
LVAVVEGVWARSAPTATRAQSEDRRRDFIGGSVAGFRRRGKNV